jgi:isocitrate/isopropylmalate dehydrogenase
MPKPTITWLVTDPIGSQLLDLAHRVLNLLKPGLTYLTGDIGFEVWKREGTSVPDRTLEIVKQSECTLLVATSPITKPQNYLDPWQIIARNCYLLTELRPIKAFTGNPLNRIDSLDIVVFRHLLEGSNTGVGFHPVTSPVVELLTSHPNLQYLSIFPYQEIALNLRVVTRQGIEQVLRQAFDFNQRNRRRGITIVDQSDLFPETAELFLQTAREMALEYPAISYQECSFFQIIEGIIHHPTQYDVIVTEHLLGDILSRLAVSQVGGTGFLSRVAIGDNKMMVGPVMESTEVHTEPSQMNPYGVLISIRMLLEFLGDAQTASILGKAVEQVILEGKVITAGTGATATNSEIVESVIDKCKCYLDLM